MKHFVFWDQRYYSEYVSGLELNGYTFPNIKEYHPPYVGLGVLDVHDSVQIVRG